MLNLNFFFEHLFLEVFGFSLIIFNILIYLISLLIIFFIFFFFNLNNFINLSNIKIFSISNFFLLAIIILFLSLLGMPPLLGFIGKFFMIIYINFKSHFFFFILFILLNLLMIYFYIQNMKFLIKKTNFNVFNILLYNNELNIFIIKILVFLLFFIIFGIFIFDDLFLIINSLLFF